MNPFAVSDTTLVLLAALVAVIFVLEKRRKVADQPGRPLPGPVPLPIVGNLFSIDMHQPWVTYQNWLPRYGEIFKVRVMNQDIIVLNSDRVVKDLLHRRSKIYSDRPFNATRKPFGWSFNFGFEPYGDRWRLQKRIFLQAFRAEAVLTFQPIQLKNARRLILDLLDTPKDWSNHVYKFSGAVLMAVVYDYEVTSDTDPIMIAHGSESPLALERLTPEMASIVKAFPWIVNLPSWIPGNIIKRNADYSRQCSKVVAEDSFAHAVKREAAGSDGFAMAVDRLKDKTLANDPERLQVLKDTCTTAIIAGGGTIGAETHCFMFAILEHPEVQERAWEELDTVIGTNRLPDFDDRPNLPYIEAILLETLRMYPILPMGISRRTMEDDIYEDFFIPKGSTVVANIWAIHHDEEVYPDSMTFKPERFLEDGKLRNDRSVESLAYGFGRRLCPGRFVADNSLWIVFVTILSAFKVSKARDDQGKEIDVVPFFTPGVNSAPIPFPCSLTPRSDTDFRALVQAAQEV